MALICEAIKTLRLSQNYNFPDSIQNLAMYYCNGSNRRHLDGSSIRHQLRHRVSTGGDEMTSQQEVKPRKEQDRTLRVICVKRKFTPSHKSRDAVRNLLRAHGVTA